MKIVFISDSLNKYEFDLFKSNFFGEIEEQGGGIT